jgi:release factor glutamine methyltransferase
MAEAAAPAGAPRTVVEVLGLSAAYLDARGFPGPRLDAELLLGHALGLSRIELYLHHDRPLAPAELDGFRALLRRRGAGEPVAYLTGTAGFRRLTLVSDARALVPRPETEVLVELALARLPEGGSLLDLGTGSGAIALAVAAERPDVAVTGVDRSREALALAAENAARLGVAVDLRESDLDAALEPGRRFDVIAANLPYVADGDERVEAGVRAFEPHEALYGGSDGLDLVRRAVAGAVDRLVPGGTLVLELGSDQVEEVRRLAGHHGLVDVAVARDLSGRERFVLARRPAEEPDA